MLHDNQPILVTGATGLVGRNLLARLLQLGWRVRGLTQSRAKASELEKLGCEVVVGDIRDNHTLTQAVSGVHHIVHLVAILRPWRDLTYESVTVKGTEALIEAAQQAGAARFVYISALGVSPKDTNPYMAAKRRAEEAVRGSGLAYTIFRPSYLYGKGSLFLALLERLTSLPVIPVIGPGTQRLQLLLVEDLAACIAASLDKEATYHKTYEIGGPEALDFNRILDLLCHTKGKPPRPKIHLPYAMVIPFAALGAKVIPTIPATPETLELLLRDSTCDVSYVQETFGVQLTPFGEGLKRILK